MAAHWDMRDCKTSQPATRGCRGRSRALFSAHEQGNHRGRPGQCPRLGRRRADCGDGRRRAVTAGRTRRRPGRDVAGRLEGRRALARSGSRRTACLPPPARPPACWCMRTGAWRATAAARAPMNRRCGKTATPASSSPPTCPSRSHPPRSPRGWRWHGTRLACRWRRCARRRGSNRSRSRSACSRRSTRSPTWPAPGWRWTRCFAASTQWSAG